ncbi:MAG TPA: ATP-binding protein, partial [Candidatus Dormibacteraeota bacterium]|nr:ATP-binding protein [Candidatus Dormibacteraeota bacterium]
MSLVGRRHETRVLDGLIAGATERGGALVIRGEPGIGKSAVIAAATAGARTRGFQVLTATGVQSEAELPFAGLHQLAHALVAGIESLPDPQRDAVRAAFGQTASATPDPFLIALATLQLLADEAGRAPLLVVAEDAQWLDRPTTNALTFVARRLESDPIVMLFAVRDGAESALLEAGLDELRLAGLDGDDAAMLLDSLTPGLGPSLRGRILDEAQGNPLALVELPAAPHTDRDGDGSIVPAPLPLTARLESAFGARYLELPGATRTALLVAALDDAFDLSEVLAAAGVVRGEAVSMQALTPAVSARLIDLSPTEMRFRHPLVRSAIHQSASLSDRLEVQRALAAVLGHDPDRHAWHLASSVIGRSEDVAAKLDLLADRARSRGAGLISVNALQRAAELTPDPARRAERLLRAAEYAFELGRRDAVVHTMRQAEPLLPLVQGALERGRVALVRGFGEPHVLSADRLESLVGVARGARDAGDANLAWNLLWRLAQRCFWADPGPSARAIVLHEAEALGATDPDPRELAVLAFAGPLERANAIIDRIADWPIVSCGAEDARLLGSAAVVVGAFELSIPLLATAVSGLREQGRLAHLARALTMQGWSALCLADWKVAIPALDEAVRMANETGEAVWGAGARAMQAILAAVRGEPDTAATLAHEAERAVISAGATHMLAYIQVARGLAALADGRDSDAFAELRRIYDSADPAHHRAPGCWYVGELADAGAHSGRVAEVRALIGELAPLAAGSQSSWIRAAFSAAEAQLAADGDADRHFQRALAEAGRWPLQRARLHLSYGTWLRRRRRLSDARPALRTARDAFDALGAVPWADRARRELRAA